MKINYLAFAAALLVTGGCSGSDNDSGNPTPEPEKKIAIRTSIETEATAVQTPKSPQLDNNGSGNFSDGDIFTLQATTRSGKATIVNYEVGSTVLYWKSIATEAGDSSVDFSACFPRQQLADGCFSFDLESAADKDLLWAQSNGIQIGSETPVDLTFKHAMHCLVINYTDQSDVATESIQTVCTAKSTCRVNLTEFKLDSSDSGKASFSATGGKVEFRLVPQNCSDVTLKVSAGETAREFNLAEVVKEHDSLQSGMRLTVNLTIRDGSILLEGCTISGWGDQGSAEGEIIL